MVIIMTVCVICKFFTIKLDYICFGTINDFQRGDILFWKTWPKNELEKLIPYGKKQKRGAAKRVQNV